MRIRKSRQVPLPFSSISPLPLPSDPNFNRSPVVQLPLHQPPPSVPSFDPPGPSSDHPNHPIGQLLPTQGRPADLFAATTSHEEDNNKKQKKKELEYYLVLKQGGGEGEGEGEGKKSNDTRKKSTVLGAELGTASSLPQPTSSHQAVGRWGEEEKAFPLKKRRGNLERRAGNINYDDEDDDNDDRIMEIKDNNNSNYNKKAMISSNNKMKTKMNKKFVQQQDDNHEQEKKLDESKERSTTSASVVNANANANAIGSVSSARKRGRGGALMEGSRCSRVNGRGWRCCQQTLVGYSLCEHHLGKGRLRSMTSVRSRSLAGTNAAAKKEQQHPPLSNPSPPQQTKRESLGEIGENGNEKEEDQKPLMMTKKRVKLGMVKARSMSSLLGQNDNAIALADDNN